MQVEEIGYLRPSRNDSQATLRRRHSLFIGVVAVVASASAAGCREAPTPQSTSGATNQLELEEQIGRTVVAAIREAIDTHLRDNDLPMHNPFGLPMYDLARNLPADYLRGKPENAIPDQHVMVWTFEPSVITPGYVAAIQQTLSQFPEWQVTISTHLVDLVNHRFVGEPELFVHSHRVRGLDQESPPRSLEDLTAQWRAEISEARDPWFGPLRRQLNYCMPRLPELVAQLSRESPVAVVAAFDNHEGNTDRTNFWILHLGGPFSIGLYGEKPGIGRGRPDIRLDQQGNVVSRTEPYATLVQWLVPDPGTELRLGPYVRLEEEGAYYYDVLEGRWSIPIAPQDVISDEQLRGRGH